MMDFLKAFPSVTRDEYLWTLTVPQVKLAALDGTHIEYLTEEQVKREKMRRNAIHCSDPSELVNDLGLPIF